MNFVIWLTKIEYFLVHNISVIAIDYKNTILKEKVGND